MRQYNIKYKAFTLIEVLVAMVIGSLVITFSYMGYMFILKYYQDFKNTNNILNEALMLNKTLENDFEQAEKVFREDDQVRMENDGKKINYRILGDVLIREQEGIADTFHVKISVMNAYFKNAVVTNKEMLIDKLSMEQEILNRKETFILQKHYASDLLMQQDSLINNP